MSDDNIIEGDGVDQQQADLTVLGPTRAVTLPARRSIDVTELRNTSNSFRQDMEETKLDLEESQPAVAARRLSHGVPIFGAEIEERLANNRNSSEYMKQVYGGSGALVAVAPMQGVQLKEWNIPCIRDFLEKRRQEEQICVERKLRGERVFLAPLTMVVVPDIQSQLAIFKFRIDVDKLTDNLILNAMDEVLFSERTTNLHTDLKIFKEIRFNVKETARTRVLNVFGKVQKLIKDNNLEQSATKPKIIKEIGGYIVDNIVPEPVKQKVKTEIKHWHKPDHQISIQDYYDTILEWSVAYDAFPREREREPTVVSEKPRDHSKKPFKGDYVVKDGQSKNHFKSQPDKSNVECYNCGKKGHYKNECKDPLKKVTAAVAVGTKEEKLFSCNLGGFVSNVLFDSGSDVSIISTMLLNAYQRSNNNRHVEVIPCKPIHCIGFDQNSSPAMATSYVNLVLEINTDVGPLLLPETKFLVLDIVRNSLILGNPDLIKTGINLKQIVENMVVINQIEQLPKKVKHVDFSFNREDLEWNGICRKLLNDEQKVEFNELKEKIVNNFSNLSKLPIDCTPITISIDEKADPVVCKQRRYSELQRNFMDEFVTDLIEENLIYSVADSNWVSPVLIVPKGDTFRLTVDLRAVNERTIKKSFPFPNLNEIPKEVAGSEYFGIIDLRHMFWQVPIQKESQKYFTFQTHRGLFRPTVLLQGAKNSPEEASATIQGIISKYPLLVQHVLIYIDDALIFAKDWDTYLSVLTLLFEVFSKYRARVNFKKSILVADRVIWCGKEFSSSGVRYSSDMLTNLRNIPKPVTASDLLQFLCAVNYVRSSIIEYARISNPLYNLLTSINLNDGKRNKKNYGKHSLEMVWKEEHEISFNLIKDRLQDALELAYPDETMELSLFTDASDEHWACIICQNPVTEGNMPLLERSHRPVFVLSGTFRGSSKNWSVIEKEAFPILMAVEKVGYMLHRALGFTIYSDHRNLKYIWNEEKIVFEANKVLLDKLARWRLKLVPFSYKICTINGSENYFADLLTRWGFVASSQSIADEIKVTDDAAESLSPSFSVNAVDNGGAHVAIGEEKLTEIRSPYILLDSAVSSEFEWPSIAEFANQQIDVAEFPSAKFNNKLKIWENDEKIIVVNTELKHRLWVIAHSGIGGHHGDDTTISNLQNKFYWSDIKEFCKKQKCFHCISTSVGIRIPRPLGTQVRATRPLGVIYMDTLYVGESSSKYNDVKYIEPVKDQFSGFVSLRAIVTPDGDSTRNSLASFISNYGIPEVLITDGGPNYANDLIRGVTERLKLNHHITVAYSPKSHGSIERINRSILEIIRRLLSELRLPKTDWPSLVPMIQFILNNAPSDRIGGLAPIEVMLRLPRFNPLSQLEVAYPIEAPRLGKKEFRDFITNKLQDINSSFKDLSFNEEVLQHIDKRAVKSRRNANLTTHPHSFQVGDFVLVARRESIASKLSATWTGPHQLIEALSDWVFRVSNLVDSSIQTVHVDRIMHYKDGKEGLSVAEREQVHYNEGYRVIRLHNVRFERVKGRYEIETEYLGIDYLSWQPAEMLYEDIPVMVSEFLTNHPPGTVVEGLKKLLLRADNPSKKGR